MPGYRVCRNHGEIRQRFLRSFAGEAATPPDYLHQLDRKWRRLGKMAAAGRLTDTPPGHGPTRSLT